MRSAFSDGGKLGSSQFVNREICLGNITMGRTNKNRIDDEFDDFDSDIVEALDFNVDLYNLDSPGKVGKGRKKARVRKKGDALTKLNSGTEIWDDDWIDPADDLMYGFDDSDHRWRDY